MLTVTVRAGDPALSAVACCHPAFFGKEKAYAEAARVPVCVLAADGDPMESVKEVLDAKPFADKCFYRRFDGQVHGFMAARGDFEKPEVAKAAADGVQCLADFFSACMPASS
jgi:dienelactone hydrolase